MKMLSQGIMFGKKANNNPRFSLTYFQSDNTRCCNNTIWPPEDEHGIAWNMSRII